MSTFRKIIIGLVILCFLMTLPPMLFIYNQPILVLGIPMFLFFIIALSLGMVFFTFLLYKYENKNEED